METDKTYIVNAFNIVLLKFIKEVRSNASLKKTFDTEFRKHMKSDKIVFDKDLPIYLEEFKPLANKIAVSNDGFSLDLFKDDVVMCGMTLRNFIDTFEKVSLENYLLTLSCISVIHDNHGSSQKDVDVLLTKLSDIEDGNDVDIDDILDDNISSMLKRLINNNDTIGNDADDLSKILNVKPEEFVEKLSNSKIATLAQEISQNIDIGNVENPKDILGGGALGNMIKTVSDTIHKKINDGSLNHEELLGEALGMMKSLNTNSLFKNMNINKNALNQMSRMTDTKSRLREKLKTKVST
jgi:hypothetical protein